jgi:DNA polymerase-3 subunit beta
VSRVITGQQALPILGNILFQVEGKRCTVSATDLEMSIVTSFEASVENEGAITIPAKAILNFAQYNSDPEILLETSEGTQLRCSSKHSKTIISGEAASEYPTITPVEKKTTFSLESGPLLQVLHLVTFSCARSLLRPVLSGVYVRSEKEGLVFVATDSYRLSEYVLQTKTTGSDISCIIPVKVLEELKGVLSTQKTGRVEGKQEEKESEMTSVQVTMSEQQVQLQLKNTILISRLIEGKFPDYQQIIPQKFSSTIKLPIRDLTTTTKRMHYFAKEVNNNLTFRISADGVKISTPTTQLGKDEATLSGEVSGDAATIALSSSYLLDFLTHAEGGELQMCVTDSMHPAVFRLPKNEQFLHLIMPLRMQEE